MWWSWDSHSKASVLNQWTIPSLVSLQKVVFVLLQWLVRKGLSDNVGESRVKMVRHHEIEGSIKCPFALATIFVKGLHRYGVLGSSRDVTVVGRCNFLLCCAVWLCVLSPMMVRGRARTGTQGV